MKIQCHIDNTRTTRGGMKITLALDDKATAEMLKNLANFNKRPLMVDFRIDETEQMRRMSIITPEQRAKIYALFKDIAESNGDNVESIKAYMKHEFLQVYGQYDDFSLSDCKNELATDFITFLVAYCFMNSVELKEHPKDIIEDIESYLYLCLKYKKCAICGRDADEHHVDAIGMGRDRRDYDDSQHEKISLCRQHHTEAHTIGWNTFAGKYHVKGIK